MVLAVLAALAVVVALAADHVSWPLTPAFPWLHGGAHSSVATKSQWQISTSAGFVARFAAVLAALLVVASVVVGLLRRNPSRGER